VIDALKGFCFYCGCNVGITSDDFPFALVPMPSRADVPGWTFELVCLRNRCGERCIDDYVINLHTYRGLQSQKYQEHPA
jgi:hypothetical protein